MFLVSPLLDLVVDDPETLFDPFGSGICKQQDKLSPIESFSAIAR